MFTATDWIRDKNRLMVLTPFPIKWAGKAAKQVYHKLRQKDTGNDAERQSLSLWERWHGVSRDGEGKPGTKEHLHSDKHWLLIELSYRCVFVLSQHPCPLSLTSFASSPKGGAIGMSVSFRLDEQSTMSRKR